jgi:ATP synthase protein I
LPDDDPAKKVSFWVQAGRMSQVAFVLPAATVLGWLGGTAMDHWLHTSWISLVGLVLGIVAGFVDLIRTVIANSK